MKITVTQLIDFINVAGPFLDPPKDDQGNQVRPTPVGKFAYAVRKAMKAGKTLYGEHAERNDDVDIEHCLEKEGKIVREPSGQLSYSKQGLRDRNKARKALLMREIDVPTFLAPVGSIPADLTEDEREAFEGFVIAKPAIPFEAYGEEKEAANG